MYNKTTNSTTADSAVNFSQTLSSQRTPLNLVKIKDPFGFLQTNPQIDAWWVGLFFDEKSVFWYTLIYIFVSKNDIIIG